MPLSTCTGEDAGESDCEKRDAGRWMKRPVSDSKELKTNMISAAAEKSHACALRPVPSCPVPWHCGGMPLRLSAVCLCSHRIQRCFVYSGEDEMDCTGQTSSCRHYGAKRGNAFPLGGQGEEHKTHRVYAISTSANKSTKSCPGLSAKKCMNAT